MDSHHWLSVISRHAPWDVVVLGGGPAGAIAARQMALQGRRVLLVEKSCLPRYKVCGGCLGGGALEVLEAIGLGDLPIRCGGVVLRNMQLANSRTVVNFAIGRRVAISRQKFDESLVHEAARVGASICDETTGSLQPATGENEHQVVLRCHGERVDVRARVVLVATGLTSLPSQFETEILSRSRIGLGTIVRQMPGDIARDTLRMACTDRGYVGVAPYDEHHVQVGGAVDPETLATARSPGDVVNEVLHEAGLAPIDGLETASWRGTPFLSRQARSVATTRCLLIGDAAGYVEPFTGEGIGWAMHSAVLASSLLAGIDKTWDPSIADRWQRLYFQTLIRQQRYCRTISRLLRIGAIRRIALGCLRRAPWLAYPVVRRLDRPLARSAT